MDLFGGRPCRLLFPLGFVLVERGALVIFDANGTAMTELGSGRATLLPAAERHHAVAVADFERPQDTELHVSGCNTGHEAWLAQTDEPPVSGA